MVIDIAPNNTVGGTVSGAGNAIANNGIDGVSISQHRPRDRPFPRRRHGQRLRRPRNRSQRPPELPTIASAIRSNTTGFTTISGTLNSNPSQSFTVQCFVAAPDPSGNGEGQVPAGQDTTVTTDAGGDGSVACVSPVLQPGQAVTAVATNTATGDTSEFSSNVGVVAGP